LEVDKNPFSKSEHKVSQQSNHLTKTSYSIFQENWWLDAVAPNSWDEVGIEEGSTLVGRFPFVYLKSFGLTRLVQPQLTQTLGPWISELALDNNNQLSYEHKTYKDLIHLLPKHDEFHQNFNPVISNWLAFYWEDFKQTTRYTYTLSDLSNTNYLFSNLPKKLKWAIRKATDSLVVIENANIDRILDLATQTYSRQNLKLPYKREVLHNIFNAVSVNASGKAVMIVDEWGNDLCGGYVVGDERRSYLLVSGQNPNFRGNGAGELLHWELIREASKFSQIFDFEGSMLPGVERFYRQFGAAQEQYFSVSKNSTKMEMLRALKNFRI